MQMRIILRSAALLLAVHDGAVHHGQAGSNTVSIPGGSAAIPRALSGDTGGSNLMPAAVDLGK